MNDTRRNVAVVLAFCACLMGSQDVDAQRAARPREPRRAQARPAAASRERLAAAPTAAEPEPATTIPPAVALGTPVPCDVPVVVAARAWPWEQVADKLTFVVFSEREEYTTLDRAARVVFAVETGYQGAKLDELSVQWSLWREGQTMGQTTQPIAQGLLDVTFDLSKLQPGSFAVGATLLKGGEKLAEGKTSFRYLEKAAPAQSGKVAIIASRPVPSTQASWPVHFGMGLPKGALSDPGKVRVVDAHGTPVPARTVVRSRWGHEENASIRWLGVDLQAGPTDAWWPSRDAKPYTLEFGPDVAASDLTDRVTLTDTSEAIHVDTGAMQFTVDKQGFNLIDEVTIAGKGVLKSTNRHGLYLIDHEGATYRAANDRSVRVDIEEQNDLRAVIRAEGWYVKDGSQGAVQHYSLPTDKLCRFITRIEAYAGKPYVRVLSTWIITYDTFGVRLRDVGVTLPLNKASLATFGVENADPIAQPVPPKGVHLIQHLPGAFAVDDGEGKNLAAGKHSGGWFAVAHDGGVIAVSHRETWQRYPKEFEVLPDSLRLHVWPAHGKDHPEVKPFTHENLHRLWFAHQGKELNLRTPWDYYFAVADIYDNASMGVYHHAGMAIAGVHSSAMGTAITSDLLLHFAAPAPEAVTASGAVAACFQSVPHMLADPQWTCDSLAMGYQHPYDPQRFPLVEDTIASGLRGYWDAQNHGQMFGMWLYRSWHHSPYNGNGTWALYRLFNGSHHYEAYMPWLMYARSGDPFYLTQGMANIRGLADFQTMHHSDLRYTHKEFHGGHIPIVGAMKHDDCINTWGNDHAILGHPTCFGGLMLAHFLTGDLRLREVVVDEWGQTLVAGRTHPEYKAADLSNNKTQAPRDNGNAVSEIIDLYQISYDPRLLALLAPRLDLWLNQDYMRPDWGFPLHHVIFWYGSEKARQATLAGCAEYRATNGKPANVNRLWDVRSPHEVFAIGGILDPRSTYALDALPSENYASWQTYGWMLRDLHPQAFSSLPDHVLFYPRVMHALTQSGYPDAARVAGAAQSMPRGTTRPTRVIVREDQDQAFPVYVFGRVDKAFKVDIYDPDHQLVSSTDIAAGFSSGPPITVPSDGKTGQYVLFVGALQKDLVLAPFTALPEVYCTGSWNGNNDRSCFFTRPIGDAPLKIGIQPHKGEATIFAVDRTTVLAKTETGEKMEVDVGPDGVWIYNRTCYIGDANSNVLALSVTREKWFAPDERHIRFEPGK